MDSMNGLFEELDDAGARLSDDKIYRYTLTRKWKDGQCIAWLMFNPSVADKEILDNTIRRCIGFSKLWGYGRLVVLNLYAVRNPNPRAVTRMGSSAVGPMNDFWIVEALKESRELICAWGCAQHAPEIGKRIAHVMELIKEYREYTPINCLGYRKDGHPRHPLMLPYDTAREPFNWK
jgi:hypothetical protein